MHFDAMITQSTLLFFCPFLSVLLIIKKTLLYGRENMRKRESDPWVVCVTPVKSIAEHGRQVIVVQWWGQAEADFCVPVVGFVFAWEEHFRNPIWKVYSEDVTLDLHRWHKSNKI